LPGSAIYDDPSAFGLVPRYERGEYGAFWFYWEPDDAESGFPFETPPEIRRARGDLIRWLRDGQWRLP
jgi:hypothetical protein